MCSQKCLSLNQVKKVNNYLIDFDKWIPIYDKIKGIALIFENVDIVRDTYHLKAFEKFLIFFFCNLQKINIKEET